MNHPLLQRGRYLWGTVKPARAANLPWVQCTQVTAVTRPLIFWQLKLAEMFLQCLVLGVRARWLFIRGSSGSLIKIHHCKRAFRGHDHHFLGTNTTYPLRPNGTSPSMWMLCLFQVHCMRQTVISVHADGGEMQFVQNRQVMFFPQTLFHDVTQSKSLISIYFTFRGSLQKNIYQLDRDLLITDQVLGSHFSQRVQVADHAVVLEAVKTCSKMVELALKSWGRLLKVWTWRQCAKLAMQVKKCLCSLMQAGSHSNISLLGEVFVFSTPTAMLGAPGGKTFPSSAPLCSVAFRVLGSERRLGRNSFPVKHIRAD